MSLLPLHHVRSPSSTSVFCDSYSLASVYHKMGFISLDVNSAPKGVDLPTDISISKIDQKIFIKCGSPELKAASKDL